MQIISFNEFLEMRRAAMEAEMNRHNGGRPEDHAFWKGRMLSYQDALSAINGTELVRAPEKGGNILVEAAI